MQWEALIGHIDLAQVNILPTVILGGAFFPVVFIIFRKAIADHVSLRQKFVNIMWYIKMSCFRHNEIKIW